MVDRFLHSCVEKKSAGSLTQNSRGPYSRFGSRISVFFRRARVGFYIGQQSKQKVENATGRRARGLILWIIRFGITLFIMVKTTSSFVRLFMHHSSKRFGEKEGKGMLICQFVGVIICDLSGVLREYFGLTCNSCSIEGHYTKII